MNILDDSSKQAFFFFASFMLITFHGKKMTISGLELDTSEHNEK